MDEIRLQKFIALSGLTSRRNAEELIKQGRVKVNGLVVSDMGFKVTLTDKVLVDGKNITLDSKNLYIMLHKPTGIVSTAKDQFGRKSVIDCVSEVKQRLYPVGRLDYDTSGLILLTNDGNLTYKLTHPKHDIGKVYIADIKGKPSANEIKAFEGGLEIEDYVTSKAKFRILRYDNGSSTVEITIHEGRNRQIRKMCEKIGHPVRNLKRVSIGKLTLGDLELGKWRHLSKEEIDYLNKL